MNSARLLQSSGWLAFFALLIAGGGYASYIAPWQRWILITAASIFGALVLIDALVNRADDHDHAGHEHHDHGEVSFTDRWLHTAVHLLPLFLFLAMGVTSLGSHSISGLGRPLAIPSGLPGAPAAIHVNRRPTPPAAPAADTGAPITAARSTTAPVVVATPTPVPAPAVATPAPTPTPPVAVVEPAHVIVDLEGPGRPEPTQAPTPAVALTPATPLTLIDLYFPSKHPGIERVEIIGRLQMPSDEELSRLPPELNKDDYRVLLYRHVINCCAADAQPVSILLKQQPATGLTKDDWVRVVGRWNRPTQIGDVAGLTVESLQPVAAPAEPYLQAPRE